MVLVALSPPMENNALGVEEPIPTLLVDGLTYKVFVSTIKPDDRVEVAVTAKVPVCVAAPLAKTLNKVAPVVEATSNNLTVGAVAAEVEIDKLDLGVVVPTPTKLLDG